MGVQDLFEGFGLGFTELGESCGDVTDGAMVLTQLRTGVGLDAGGDEAIGGERIGEGLQPLGTRRDVGHAAMAIDHCLRSLAREAANRIGSAVLLEVVQGSERKIVVPQVEGMAPSIGEREYPGRPAAAANGLGPERAAFAGVDQSLLSEGFEVPAHEAWG